MKGFLFFVILILSGALALTLYRAERGGEYGEESLEELEDEILEARAETGRLREELASFKTRLRKYEPVEETSGSPAGFSDGPAPAIASEPASPEAVPVRSAGTRSERLQRLQDIYEANSDRLRRERKDAEQVLADAEVAYKLLERAEPEFKEHTVRTDDTGAILGNSGTRTSNADRDRAMAKYHEELAALRNQVAAARRRVSEAQDRSDLLDRQYRDAVRKVEAELSAKP